MMITWTFYTWWSPFPRSSTIDRPRWRWYHLVILRLILLIRLSFNSLFQENRIFPAHPPYLPRKVSSRLKNCSRTYLRFIWDLPYASKQWPILQIDQATSRRKTKSRVANRSYFEARHPLFPLITQLWSHSSSIKKTFDQTLLGDHIDTITLIKTNRMLETTTGIYLPWY